MEAKDIVPEDPDSEEIIISDLISVEAEEDPDDTDVSVQDAYAKIIWSLPVCLLQ